MIYDDSSGLIASQLGSNDQTITSNHNLAHFEETGSLAGPSSSISLLPRSNEGESFFFIFLITND